MTRTDHASARRAWCARCCWSRYCGRLSAARLGDIGFGCQCQVNPRRERQTTKPAGSKQRDLLKDSELPVLDWWDHEQNDAATWETVTVKARREATWRCPDCGLRFRKRILAMVNMRECPECQPKRRAEREAEHARYQATPVADLPELLAAWDDEADPRTVMVADSGTVSYVAHEGTAVASLRSRICVTAARPAAARTHARRVLKRSRPILRPSDSTPRSPHSGTRPRTARPHQLYRRRARPLCWRRTVLSRPNDTGAG
ncbi:hypothetical protein SALBM311S_02279 [Streptomyces alboniger]